MNGTAGRFIPCSYCNKAVWRTPSKEKRFKNVFCNMKCCSEFNRTSSKLLCAYCGVKIVRKQSRLRIYKNHFCSKECSDKYKKNYNENIKRGNIHPCWKGGKIEIQCAYCGRKLLRKQNDIKRRNNSFCNQQCFGRWERKRIKTICLNCNQEIEINPHRLNTNVFCNRTCHHQWMHRENHPNWQGGLSFEPYNEIWSNNKFKEQIKKRDNYRCANPLCLNNSKRLSIHHINYNKKDCNLSNLITLCIGCNSKANKHREWHELWYKRILNKKEEINWNIVVAA